MGLLSALKAYLAERLDVHFTSNNKAKKQLFKNKVKAKGDVTQNILVVNLPRAKPEEQSEMLKELADRFNKGELVFVDDETKRLADSVQAAESDTENGALVKFLRINSIRQTGRFLGRVYTQII